jgi:hypothetical protein
MSLMRKRFKLEPYTDGKVIDVDIRTVRKLRSILISFVGTLTVAGGAADGTLVEDGVLKTLFKKLEVIAGGKTFYDTRGVDEYWRRAIVSGSAGVLVSPAVVVGSSAVRAFVALDMDQIQRFNLARFAGRLNADLLDSLNLRIESGTADGDLVTGGDRTETLTGTYEVIADHVEQEWKGGHRQVSNHRLDVVGASTDGRITLPSGLLISHILLRAVKNNARNNDILIRAKVQIGEDDIRYDQSFEAIQEENVEDFGLTTVSGAPPYTGLAVINFNKDGDMDPKKLLDLRGLKDRTGRITMEVGAIAGSVNFVDATVYGVRTQPIPK